MVTTRIAHCSLNNMQSKPRCPRSSTMSITCAASAPRVVGVGSCGIDYLAAVAAFPQPDEKLRTQQLELQGGGNAANALTAAARLGVHPSLVAVIGDDAMGDAILQELACDGVDTTHVLRPPNTSSPFTYIIVDQSGGTRTCIHTPGAAYPEAEVTQQRMQAILGDSCSLLYFDGRHTPAAIRMARIARGAGVPVLVEAESLRPHLDVLLQEADYVVTSTGFPTAWTGESGLGSAIVSVMQRLPRVQWMIVTLGKRGALCVQRAQDATAPTATHIDADTIIQQLLTTLEQQPQPNPSVPDCITLDGLQIRAGAVVEDAKVYALEHGGGAAARAQAAQRAQAAAERAALARADGGNEEQYVGGPSDEEARVEPLVARVTVVAAADLPQECVVDTTGAGDAFIGSIVYGLATGLALKDAMRLGTVVAACKCTALGPRPGLPTVEQLSKHVLEGRVIQHS